MTARVRGMSQRNRELLLLLPAALVATVAWGSAWMARARVVEASSLMWAGSFLALMLVAHVTLRRFAPLADPVLLPATALLCGLGIAEIYRLDPDLAGLQTAWLVVGLSAMTSVLVLLPDPGVLARYRYVIAAGSALMLMITVSPLGNNVRGSQLWISIGPINIQPGELAKVGIVIFLAAHLRETRDTLMEAGQASGIRDRLFPHAEHVGPLVLFWGLSLALFVLMNDFGTSLLFFLTFVLMLYVGTGNLVYVASGVGMFAAGAMTVVRIAPHVQRRFDTWLDPWKDPQDTGFQIVQGLFALADGGVTGTGIGRAYLVTDSGNPIIPDAHNDFIFAALGNELGLLGAVGILLVYVAFAWRGMRIAIWAPDGFSRLLAFGLTAVFTMQSLIIVGGVVRLLPLTGQTLPFMSYGGSSIVANFLLLGLLLVLSHRTQAAQLRRSQEPAL